MDFRVWKNGEFWGAYLNDDKQIASGARSKEDAIELAEMSVRFRPSNPVPMDVGVLDQKRRYEKHFEQDEDPLKLRGSFALKPKDKLKVTKGSNLIGIPARATAIVADVYQIKGEREVRVKLLVNGKTIALYATHANRLAEDEIPLLSIRGTKVFVTKA